MSHSRLIDVHGILLSLRNVYSGVKPLMARSSAAQSNQIGSQLNALSAFVDGIYAKETAGKQFRPNEADLLGLAGAKAGKRDRRAGQPGRRRARDQAAGLRSGCSDGRHRVRFLVAALAVALLRSAGGVCAAAAQTEPWQAYQQLDTGLFDLQLGVTLGDRGQSDHALGQVERRRRALPSRSVRLRRSRRRGCGTPSSVWRRRSLRVARRVSQWQLLGRRPLRWPVRSPLRSRRPAGATPPRRSSGCWFVVSRE